ncbi:hypothetical protein E2C01_084469 [Portunus trituberculatus]|uniref:Uncharacterized protein n=1 Tax=Portunus trituberculatus TaxID=210409 RepID=A0A5B7J9C3_PORTR|nr:hypothetical protein [Portunus trituberculatus]
MHVFVPSLHYELSRFLFNYTQPLNDGHYITSLIPPFPQLSFQRPGARGSSEPLQASAGRSFFPSCLSPSARPPPLVKGNSMDKRIHEGGDMAFGGEGEEGAKIGGNGITGMMKGRGTQRRIRLICAKVLQVTPRKATQPTQYEIKVTVLEGISHH